LTVCNTADIIDLYRKQQEVAMNTTTWIQKHTSSLSGKMIAISGATGGIGKELCNDLAMLGATLVLLDRNQTKSAELQNQLTEKYPTLSVRRIAMDLEDMNSVKHAASELQKMPLDGLVLNAGAYYIPRHKCTTGVDNIFQINFLAPYYLAKNLKPHLDIRSGKIVAVGSIAHTYSKTDPNDIDFSTRSKHSQAYGNAKRFLMYALHGLYGGNSGLAVTHPGITFTNITAHYPKWIFAIIKHPMKVIFMKPRKACLSILRGLFEDCKPYEWIGPKYFDIWGYPKKRMLHSCDKTEASFIFETAEALFRTL